MTAPVAGYRFEPLDRPAGTWVTVDDVVVDPSQGVAFAKVKAVVQGHPAPQAMALPKLTRSFGGLHQAVLAMSDADKVNYWRRVATALQRTRIPILVTERDGSWQRSAGSVVDAQGSARILLSWKVSTWRVHIEKHLASDEGAAYFESVLRRSHVETDWAFPFAGWHVERAWRHAKSAASNETLPAEWWPLAEIYAAVTQELFCQMLTGPAVHVVRCEPTSVIVAFPFGVEDGLHLGPYEEVLYVAPLGSTLAVAKGKPDPEQPLWWSTTHRRDQIDICLTSRVLEAQASLSCTVAANAVD